MVAVTRLERRPNSPETKSMLTQDLFLDLFCAQERTQTSSEADEEIDMSEAERALEKEKLKQRN